jgi:competence protein ComEA
MMWQSLLLKLGMFTATMAVVFWIGWSLPNSLEREHGLPGESLEGSKADIVSDSSNATVESASSPSMISDQPAIAAASKRTHTGLLNLNRATEREFDALPGIGPELAERIMEYRRSVGAFHSLEELRAVKGIGKKTFDRIRPLVTVTPNAELSERQKKTT